jgi:hypothetical protein
MANKLNEDLERFKSLLDYDPKKGNEISESKIRREAPGYRDMMNEAEPEDEGGEEENEEPTGEEGGENTDFDFGEEGSPEEGEEGGFGEEPAGEEGVEDEFGTAGEFSAVDDLENSDDEEVEEIDVTSIVKGSDEAKEMAQQAVTVGQENSSYLKSLTDKLSNLETQLSKMDTIASKIGKLEQDIKTPEEKLELRSLDSFPFNMKLSDYWSEKAKTDDRYRISTGEEVSNGQEKEYVLTPEELDSDYSEEEIKNSFNPKD